MNIAELGIIVFEAQKGKWEDSDFEHFIWRMTQMLDHDLNEDDLQEYTPEIKWVNKKSGKEET